MQIPACFMLLQAGRGGLSDSAGGAEAHEQGVDERPSQAVLDAARAAATGQACMSPDDLLPGALLRLASCWATRT